MNDLWDKAFLTPLHEFFTAVGEFLPRLLAMLVIIGMGFAIAWVAETIMARLLKVTKFDQFSARVGFTESLSKGGVRDQPSHVISRIVYWAIFLIFLMLGLGALQLPPVDQFVAQTFAYAPHLIMSLIILMVGFILANFFSSATLIAAVNAQIAQARILARAVRLAIILFTLAMAFEQLGIATSVILAAFSISFGGLVLAMAIAFGLGAKDVAREFIERRLKKDQKAKEEEEFSHL